MMAVWSAVLLIVVPYELRRLGLLRKNFRGDVIPAGFGIYILLWMIPVFAVWLPRAADQRLPLAYAMILIYGILGFVDDKWGSRQHSGLKGHLKGLLVDHTVTTGLIKAVGGLAVGVAAGLVVERNLLASLLAGVIIALMSNAFNLLDLRPGRAGALFLLFAVVLIAVASPIPVGLVLAIIPAFIVYIPDSHGRVMLGDAGSNLLGALLGLSLILAVTSPAARMAILITLIALHIATEKLSLTELIERNPFLRRLDGLTGVR